MDSNVGDLIEVRPDLALGLRAANDILERELGLSGSGVKVVWSLDHDEKGRDLVHLRVSDWTGAVEYRFAPDELGSPPQIRRRLHRLWGDLLQVRSHVQLDNNWWSLETQREP